jgi:hypothetical protein
LVYPAFTDFEQSKIDAPGGQGALFEKTPLRGEAFAGQCRRTMLKTACRLLEHFKYRTVGAFWTSKNFFMTIVVFPCSTNKSFAGSRGGFTKEPLAAGGIGVSGWAGRKFYDFFSVFCFKLE